MTIHRLRTTYITLFALAAFLLTCPIPARAQTLADLGLTSEGYYDVQLPTHMSSVSGVTVRYVNGEQRFLGMDSGGQVFEFRLAAAGAVSSTVTNRWALGAYTKSHRSMWYEQAKSRLWIASTEDYTSAFANARVTLVTLNDNGSTTMIGQWNVGTLPEKRCYGNAQPSPFAAGKYILCAGGYTSLVMQSGGAAMGPVLYEIAEPTSQASGSTLQARPILDAYVAGTRGVRRTIADNFFDGGDPRPNPSTPPAAGVKPSASAQWLMPNAQGLGWMTWGDSYYSTLMVLPDKRILMVASLCKTRCYYMSSSLHFDSRQWEIHEFDPATLTGANLAVRPTRMVEFTGPFGADYRQIDAGTSMARYLFSGNVSDGNIASATYDATAGRIYLGGGGLGKDVGTLRIWALRVGAGGTLPPPVVTPPTPPPTIPPTTPPSTALPPGYVLLIDEGKQATVPANTLVYFGDAKKSTSFRSLTVSGTFWCNNSTFKGDPLPGNGKFCYGPGATSPPPPPPVVDANAVMSPWVLSSWTEWSACAGSSQSRSETWTRTVVTPATGNGTTGAMSESRTGTQACTVPLAAPTIDTSAVSQCSVTLSAVPPAGSSWRLQFLEGASNRGSQVTAAPYRQTFTLAAGSHAIVARWTKSGATTQNSPAVTVACP